MADFFISNSTFSTRMYQNSFWYDGRILEVGSPRCDIFFENTDELRNKINSQLKLIDKPKILIYAPTFRSGGSLEFYDIDFESLKRVLKIKFGGEWLIFMRIHPNISYKSCLIDSLSDVINVSYYDDMYELLAVSDILITDYSSTMFEFSLKYKPVFLYCKDIEKYRKERDYYFNFNDLPYSISQTNQQLFEIIQNFDDEEYRGRVDSFYANLNLKETGNASKEVVKLIRDLI